MVLLLFDFYNHTITLKFSPYSSEDTDVLRNPKITWRPKNRKLLPRFFCYNQTILPGYSCHSLESSLLEISDFVDFVSCNSMTVVIPPLSFGTSQLALPKVLETSVPVLALFLRSVLWPVPRLYDAGCELVREIPNRPKTRWRIGFIEGRQAASSARNSSRTVQAEMEIPTAHVSAVGSFHLSVMTVLTTEAELASRPVLIRRHMMTRSLTGLFSFRRNVAGARDSKMSVVILMAAPVEETARIVSVGKQ